MRLVAHKESNSFAVVEELTPEVLSTYDPIFLGTLADAKAMRKVLEAYIESQPEVEITPIDLKDIRDDDIVGAYIKLRDMRDTAKKKFESRDDKYAARIDSLQMELLRRYEERGIDQIKIAGIGTSFKSTKTVASCGDWDVFFSWCLDQADKLRSEGGDPRDVFAFFQKRLTIDTVKQYMEAHEGGVPPAVNVMQQYTVSVRRSTT
jgi:hypothetical protein